MVDPKKILKEAYRLNGKPSERLILIGLCKRYNVQFKINETTGNAVIAGVPNDISQVHDAYYASISIAYKKLAMAMANPRLASIPAKTLTSEFMQAYAAMAYSLITGERFMFKAETESHRAGLKAGGQRG